MAGWNRDLGSGYALGDTKENGPLGLLLGLLLGRYYHRKGHTTRETWDMLRDLLVFIEVPTVGKSDLLKAWRYALTDFEDALQVACGEADRADLIITRNIRDFTSSPIAACTPEDSFAQYGGPPP